MDAHLDLDPDVEERRKRKHPCRAAEASPELRSERGLRRRWAPRFLALGAVAGEGDGEGEAFLGFDAEAVLEVLGMAAAAVGMATRGGGDSGPLGEEEEEGRLESCRVRDGACEGS